MVMGGCRDQGWRRVGLGLCKVGGVGSRSNRTPWILCFAVFGKSALFLSTTEGDVEPHPALTHAAGE